MLHVVRKGWFSYDFEVLDIMSGAPVGQSDQPYWRETAKLDMGGVRYEATHRGRKEFLLWGETARRSCGPRGPQHGRTASPLRTTMATATS